jgi:hypothetical protein
MEKVMDNYAVESDVAPLESHTLPPDVEFKPDTALDAALNRAEEETGQTGTLEKVRNSVPKAALMIAGAVGVVALAVAGGVTWFLLPKKPKLFA